MADLLVKQVMTEDGPAQIDYTALANLPKIPTVDATLKADSANAIQNKAVKSAVDEINNAIGGINTSLDKVLGEDGKVANSSDSEKLGGQEPSYYATAESVTSLETEVGSVKTLAEGKAPISHAFTDTTYGAGDANNFGHVKLADSVESSDGVTSGVAATPLAVKTVNDKLGSISKIEVLDALPDVPEENVLYLIKG